MNFVVVGAGPTGVETAGALSELKHHILPTDYPELDLRRMQIHLIEAGDRILPGMSAEASDNALKALQKMGVHIWLNARVERYDGVQVHLAGPRELDAMTVIWSAGVVGASIPGLETALGRGGRMEVDQFNRVKGQTHVFAIGDIALMRTEDYPAGHPGVAQVAIQQGQLLARNIKSLIFQRELRAFQYKDLGSMATIGRNKAVGDLGRMKVKGWIAWLMWLAIHLFSLAGFRNRVIVFINWFWSYLTYDKGTRLIIRPFKRKVEYHHPEPVEQV
jgi:NADH dehydrogenase